MKNVIIVGSGRSGTSMVIGLFAKNRPNMGGKLYPPDKYNKKGYFEASEKIHLNENLLEPAMDAPLKSGNSSNGQRWLGVLENIDSIPSTRPLKNKIKELVRNIPFCYKDPRFSYTLQQWCPHFENTVFICIFRDPNATAKSIVDFCKRKKLTLVNMKYKKAFQVWACMYTHILETHSKKGDWLFLHFNQLFDEQSLFSLEDHTDAIVDRYFPDPNLSHSQSDHNIFKSIQHQDPK